MIAHWKRDRRSRHIHCFFIRIIARNLNCTLKGRPQLLQYALCKIPDLFLVFFVRPSGSDLRHNRVSGNQCRRRSHLKSLPFYGPVKFQKRVFISTGSVHCQSHRPFPVSMKLPDLVCHQFGNSASKHRSSKDDDLSLRFSHCLLRHPQINHFYLSCHLLAKRLPRFFRPSCRTEII